MSGIRVRVRMKGGSQEIENLFQKHEVSIGRGPANDVILKRENVSKSHCRATFVYGVVLVGDSGSAVGTYVNGSRVVGWMPVGTSDEVMVGDYVVTFTAESAAVRKAPGRRGKRERTSGEEKTQSRQESHGASEPRNAGTSSGEKQERPRAKSPWDVLEIPRGTPKAEAKKAYLKQLALYHPDRVDSLGPKLKELALEVTRELNEAWAKIESNRA